MKPTVRQKTKAVQIPEKLVPLFNDDQKLVKNQLVRVTGLLEYDTPDNAPTFPQNYALFTEGSGARPSTDLTPTHPPYALLTVVGGDFDVLPDAIGKQFAKTMDMQTAGVQGHLTGKSFVTLSNPSLTSTFTGTTSGVSRIPELKIEKYEAVTLDPATARSVENELYEKFNYAVGTGFLGAVRHLIKGHPELINMKPHRDGWTPLHTAVSNHNKDVADFLRQRGGHE